MCVHKVCNAQVPRGGLSGIHLITLPATYARRWWVETRDVGVVLERLGVGFNPAFLAALLATGLIAGAVYMRRRRLPEEDGVAAVASSTGEPALEPMSR